MAISFQPSSEARVEQQKEQTQTLNLACAADSAEFINALPAKCRSRQNNLFSSRNPPSSPGLFILTALYTRRHVVLFCVDFAKLNCRLLAWHAYYILQCMRIVFKTLSYEHYEH